MKAHWIIDRFGIVLRLYDRRRWGLLFVIGYLTAVLGGCGGSETASDSAQGTFSYGHPGVTGGGSTGSTAPSGRLARLVSGTSGEDLTVELATTAMTIRAGTFQRDYKALLMDLGGELTQKANLKFISLPIRLRTSDSDGPLTRTDASRNIEVTVTAAKTSDYNKATILILDYSAASESEPDSPQRQYLRLSEMGTSAGTNDDGYLFAQFEVRSTDFAVVMASSTTGDPSGFEDVPELPEDPTSVAVSATEYPDRLIVTWRAPEIIGQGFAVVANQAPTVGVCTTDDEVEFEKTGNPDTTASDGTTLVEYTTTLSGLADNTTFAVRVCSHNDRSPPDFSGPGAIANGTTIARALAVLTNTPDAYTQSQSTSITVGGDEIVSYKFGSLTGTSCDSATMSSNWIAVSQPVTLSGLADGVHSVCVLGKKTETNVQIVPTRHTWTVDTTPPTIDAPPGLSEDLTANNLTGVNIVRKAADFALHGAATVSGASAVYYQIASDLDDCASATYPSVADAAIKSSAVSTSGNYKICTKAVDQAGNMAFGYSDVFGADLIAPGATQWSLANDATDGYINTSESTSGANLTGNITPSESLSLTEYQIAQVTSDCSVVTGYVTTMPTSAVLGLGSDGSYKICARMTDQMQNIGFAESDVVILDTVNPNLLSGMEWTGLAADGYLNGVEVLQNSAILTAAVANETATYSYRIIANSGDCSVGTYSSSALPQADSAELSSDGTWIGCVEMTDSAGNSSYAATSIPVVRDTVPPSLTSFALANVAEDSFVSATDRNSSLVLAGPLQTDDSNSTSRFKLIPDSTTCGMGLTFGNAVPAANSPDFGADGDYRICVEMTDVAGNVAYGESPPMTLDVTAPVFTSMALANEAADGYVNDSEKNSASDMVDVEVASGATGSGYLIALATVDCSQLTGFNSQRPAINDPALSGDGSWKVCVRLSDDAGNVTFGESDLLIRDTVMPSLASGLSWDGGASNGFLNAAERGQDFAITTAATADESSTYRYAPMGQADNCSGAYYSGASLVQADTTGITADGFWKVCVEMTDLAGNIAHAETATLIEVDTVIPALASGLSWDGVATDGYLGVADRTQSSDLTTPGSASETATLEYSVAIQSAACSGVVYSSQSVPAADSAAITNDGSWNVCLKMTDQAGNIGFATTASAVVVDTAAPNLVSGLQWEDVAADGYLNISDRLLTNTVITEAVADEVTTNEYIVAMAGSDCAVATYAGGQQTQADSLEMTGDGSWTVCVKMTDGAGNAGFAASQTPVVVDTVIPVLTAFPLSGAASDGFISSVDRSSSAAMAASMVASSDVASQGFKLVSDGTTCDGSLTFGSNVPSGNSADFGADGTYRICVELTDAAGNVGYGVTSDITLDTTAPVFVSLGLANEASDGYINDIEKSSSADMVGSVVATGSVAEYYAAATATADCSTVSGFGGAVTKINDSALISDGSWKVCVRLEDAAGNVAYGQSGSVIRDTVAPVLISFPRVNVAQDGYVSIDDRSSNSALAGPVSSSSDTVSYGYKLILNGTTCGFALSFGSSVPAADSSDFSSDGTYTVCVQMLDAAGNIGYGTSPDIILDLTPPVFTSIALANEASDGFVNDVEKTSTAAVVSQEVGAGYSYASYDVLDASGDCSTGGAYNAQIPLISDTRFNNDGSWKVCVRLVDDAGNDTFGNSGNLIWDTIAPQLASGLSWDGVGSDGYLSSADRIQTSALLTVAVADESSTYRYSIVGAGGNCAGATYAGSSLPSADTSLITGEGSWFGCVEMTDLAGNKGYQITASPVVLDSSAPTLASGLAWAGEAGDGYLGVLDRNQSTAITTAAVANETATYKYLATQNGSDCSNQTYVNTALVLANDNGINADGAWQVCVMMTDASGNIGYGVSSSAVIVDTVAPSLASGLAWTGLATDSYLSSAERGQSSAIVTAAVADETSTYKYLTVAATADCSAASFSSSSVPGADAAEMTSDGAWKVCAKMTDAAGNIAYAATSSSVTVDTAAPTLSSFPLANDASDSAISSAERSSTSALAGTVTASETTSALGYKLIPDGTTCGVALSFGSSVPAADSNDFGADGVYRICVRMTDTAGNIGYGVSPDITLDVAAPVFVSMALANDASDGYINDSEKASTANLVSAAIATGASTSEYVVVAATATCSEASGFSSTIPKVNDATITADGSWKVCVKLSDTSGNVTYGASDTVIRDTVAPTLSSGLAWTGLATDSYLSSAERGQSSAIVTAAVADETSTYKYLTVAATADCSAASFSSSSVPGADAAEMTADGAWKVCAKMTDAAGNIAYAATASTVTVDTVAPTLSSFPLANDASDSAISSAERSSTSALAGTVTASETTSALGYKLIPDGTTCGVALSFGSSVPAADSNDFGADGVYRICVRMTDTAGNIGYGVSPDITLDVAAPIFVSMALANDAADGYINDSEKASTANLVSAAVATGASTSEYVVVDVSVTCSSASGFSSTIPKVNDSAITADGSWKVCVKLSDTSGNTTYGNSDTVIRDIVAPTLSSGLAWTGLATDSYLSSTERSQSSAIVTAAVADETSTYKYLTVAATADCSAASFSSSSVPGADAAEMTADGAWKVCAKMTDAAGNIAYAATSSSVTVDTLAPTLSSFPLANDASDSAISSAERSSTSALAGTVTASETTSALGYKLIPDGTTCGVALSFGSSVPAADSNDFGADGVYRICVRMTDTAGNIGYGVSPDITLDVAAPVFVSMALANDASDGYINDSEKESTANLVSAAVAMGASTSEYVVVADSTTCSAASGFSGTIPKVNDAAITADGSWKVCVKLSDAAGNFSYGNSNSIIRDTVAPTLSSSLSLKPPADDGALNSLDRSSSNNLVDAASMSESGSAQYSVSTSSCSGLTNYSSSIVTANSVLIDADGTWHICVKLSDSAGNVSYDASADFTVDTILPVFASIDLVNTASDGYINAAEISQSTALGGNLSGSGYTTANYKLVMSSTTCGTPLSFGSMPAANSSDFGDDGNYKICVQLGDAAGNLTYGQSSDFVLDTEAPVFTSLSLINAASDDFVGASERSQTSAISGSLSASGHTDAKYGISTASGACSAVSSWTSSSPNADDGAIVTDGSYKVCVRLSDVAGNITYGSTSAFTVDTSGPSLASPITLSGDAADTYISSSELGGSTAVISTPSFGETVTLTYILTQSSADCSNGAGWGSSVPASSAFASSPNNSDGSYKVCVQAVDSAGNSSYHAGPTIIRDTTTPVFNSIALINAASDSYLNAAERLLQTTIVGSPDAEAGSTPSYAVVQSSVTCDENVAFFSSVPSANDGNLASEGGYKICVRLADVAGNNGYGSSSLFTVDTTSASFSSVALANVAADGYLSIGDRLSSLALVSDAVTVGADDVYYALVTDSASCNATATFGTSGAKPSADSVVINSDGDWKVCVKVADAAGNPPSYGSSSSFTVDTARPVGSVSTSGSLSIGSTSGASTTISGTISDSSPSSGIQATYIYVADAAGNCLNSSMNAFSETCPSWISASVSGANAWSLSVADGMFLKDATYSVGVTVFDVAGNEQSSNGTGTFSWSAPEGTDLWNTNVTFAGTGSAKAIASVVDSQGRLVVAGFDTSGSQFGRLKRFTRHGVLDSTFDVTLSSTYIPHGIAIGPSDSIYVVGSFNNGSNLDWFIKKFSSSGVEDTNNWDLSFNGLRNGQDEAMAVAVDGSGNVIVGGYSTRATNPNAAEDWHVRIYASNGAAVCNKSIDVDSQGENDRILSLVVLDSTSRFYVAGYSESSGTGRGWALGEFNLNNCNLVNDTVINRGSADEAYSIAIDSSAQLVVAGVTTEHATSPDLWLEVMSTSFVSVCAVRTDLAAASGADSVVVDSLDNIYVGGYRSATNENWSLRKFSSSCVEDTANWSKIVNGGGNGNDRIQSLAISTGNNDVDNIYAIGWGVGVSAGSGNEDWWIKKYSGAQ